MIYSGLTTTAQMGHSRPASATSAAQFGSASLSRLLSAAIISTKFCQKLLHDPLAAVKAGYNGESFELSPQEMGWITEIKADSLREFAAKLLVHMEQDLADAKIRRVGEVRSAPFFREVGRRVRLR